MISIAHIALLLHYAVSISGYSMPNAPLPKVEELTHKEMVAEGCTGHRPCDIYGFYKDNEIVKVDPWLIRRDHISEDAIIVHELAHWLQQHHGKSGFSCRVIKAREREAYAVQNAYMQEVEHNYAFFRVPDLGC